ncbi:MAG: aminodeoxychorismate synthase, component I [Nitrospirota bacterium]|nr:aminodeoxychorismate synthase, component I [Nitrospirota bacterium]
MITPSKEEFLNSCKSGVIAPLSLELSTPLSPWDAFRRIRGGKYNFLLESVRPGGKIARYSFAGTDPYRVFKCKGDTTEIIDGKGSSRSDGDPVELLRQLTRARSVRRSADLPPFLGGAVGFLGYEFSRHFEKLPSKATDDLGLPDAWFMMVDTFVAWDHEAGRQWIIGVPGCRGTGDDPAILYDECVERMHALAARLSHEYPRSSGSHGARNITVKPLISKARYEEMVRRCKEYIAAGDIYQANLSQRLSAELGDVDPLDLYDLLREINPSPFAAYLDFDGVQIVSSSPERLFRVSDGVADTRPIAGTRPRGADRAGDTAMSAELITSPKERAEHIMLVDLERNDLGRVCEFGSVEVDELMVLEEYSHVIHIVSNVRGRLLEGKDCFDVLKAGFPGGTITGVPKVRCMEIIDELEPVARGPYTGSVGYFSFNGEMDTNIIIRTFVIKDNIAYVQVGAGIVADSDPEREYFETLHKAEALLKTLERV